MKTGEKRIAWLDAAKGIGILLVIVGHCLNMDGNAFQLIFTFHVPLFFILSGYVFKGNTPFTMFLKKKVKGLLLPFFGFYLLGLIFTIILPQWRESLTLSGIRTDLILGDPNQVHNSSIWFLICLFFVSLLFWAIQKFSIVIQIMALTASYIAGIWYSETRVEILGYNRLPLDLDAAMIAIVFFAFGFYLSKSKVLKKNKTRDWIITVILVGFIGMIIIYYLNGYVNLHGLTFGNPVLYLFGAIFGSAVVIAGSIWVTQSRLGFMNKISNGLMWYGRHSLFILGLQSLLIRLYIEVVNNLSDAHLELYHFSGVHSLVSIIIVAGVLCPLICAVIDYMRTKVGLLR